MNSRNVNIILFVAILLQFLTGLLGLLFSSETWQLLFVSHNLLGTFTIAMLFWKVQISLRSLRKRPGHYGQKLLSLTGAVFLILTLVTGVLWVLRLSPIRALGGITLISLHMYVSAALGILFAAHSLSRYPRPKPTDFTRRGVLRGMAGASLAALAGWWLLERASPFGALAQGVERIVGRRFTGSRNAQAEWNLDSCSFPQTQLLIDNPAPLDAKEWQLHITGNVGRTLSFDYDSLIGYRDSYTAVLDCTGGWFPEQTWTGVTLARLLEGAEIGNDAKLVYFRSITGYVWPIPIDEARAGLLATQVCGAPLAHGHGYPLRIVLPGRRGLQWVKWLTEIEIV